MAGTELLLSMVEARWAQERQRQQHGPGEQDAPGTGENRATYRPAASRPPGQTTITHREIEQLHDRIDALRNDMSSAHYNAWQKTELARHPQRPYSLGLHRTDLHRLQ